jgi:Terminase large subunit, T4likevirus-type, N-terminal
MLEEIELLQYLTEDERAEVNQILSDLPCWIPDPRNKPQCAAYESEADVIGYGGAAGGGKTDLLLGFAGTKHHRSIIFRRVFPLLEGIEARSREIFNASGPARVTDSYNESLHRWQLQSGATIRLAAVQYEDDKKNYQGRPHDFYGFDEATEFTESQVRFIIGWNRSTKQGQKCRVVLVFNPPMDESGEWVVRFFAPWLDETHSRPAKDGELRWFAMLDGEEKEVDSESPFIHNGETITPKSRTFFHAKLSDNVILEQTGYQSQIDAMPEPIRSILKGNFGAYKQIDPFQVIPAAWVRAAQKRWLESEPVTTIKSLGVDVARGGGDKTVISILRLDRFDELKKYPGVSTPDGQTVALLVNDVTGKQKPVIGVDVIGIGASVYDQLDSKGNVIGVNFGAGSDKTDKSRKFRFANLRAEVYWTFREALDPDYNPTLALPPDKELLGDLCAPKWEIRTGKIYIESKPEIIKRLGRSPDCGDSVVIAYWSAIHGLITWDSGLGKVENFKSRWGEPEERVR